MQNIFDEIGRSTIQEIVNLFYEKVEKDPILRPLYRDDLTEPKHHLIIYLVQVFGGPQEYREERGKPKLKFRHVPFTIGQKERDRWMTLMTNAVKSSKVHQFPDIESEILEFFDRLSTQLINDTLFTVQAK